MIGAKNARRKKVSTKLSFLFFVEKIAISVLLTTLFYHGLLPQYAFASLSAFKGFEFPYDEKLQHEYLASIEVEQKVEKQLRALQQLKERARERFHVITAYSSTIWETDDSPFITASGKYVRDGIIAANTLPFGAKVMIPDIFGDKVFTVEDRMATKNYHKIDIWFPSTREARHFGVKKAKILILPSEASNILKHLEA